MRTAIKDGDDVVEFQLINGVWLSEDCEIVTFDFSMAVLAAAGILPGTETRPAPMPSASAEPVLTANLPVGFLN